MYAFEHMGFGSYPALMRAAEAVGDVETKESASDSSAGSGNGGMVVEAHRSTVPRSSLAPPAFVMRCGGDESVVQASTSRLSDAIADRQAWLASFAVQRGFISWRWSAMGRSLPPLSAERGAQSRMGRRSCRARCLRSPLTAVEVGPECGHRKEALPRVQS
jgi:hypothetical protein